MSQGIQFKASVTKKFAVLNSIKEEPTWFIPKTWNSILYNQVQSTNGASSSQLQFPLNNINQNYLLGNCPIVKCQYQFTGTVSNASGADFSPLVNGLAAPNAFPLAKSTQSSICNLGGGQILTAAQDFFAVAVSSHTEFFKDLTSWSGCANACDTFINLIPPGLSGSPKNPLGDYTTSVYGNQGRLGQSKITGYSNSKIATGSSGNCSVNWTSYEPVFNGMLCFDPESETCISGLVANGSFIQLNLVNLAGNAFKYVETAGTTLTAYNVTFTTTPILFYMLYDPYPMVPPKLSYYKALTFNNRAQSQALMPNADGTVQLTVNFQDTLINKCVYIWVVDVLASAKTALDGDSPGWNITNLQFQYANQPSQFTTFDEYALYKYFIAEQGSIKSWNETSYSTQFGVNTVANTLDLVKSLALYGSVLRIPAELITGYDRTLYGVGSAYLQNLSVTVTAQFTGLSTDATTPAILFVQCVDEDLVKIENGVLVDVGTTSIVTPTSVAATNGETPVILEKDDMVGGSILGKIGTIAKKAHEHYRTHKDTYHALAKTALNHPLAQQAIGHVASKIGLGGKMHHKRMHNRRGRGFGSDEDYEEDEMQGGSLISQSEINNRLKNL